MRTEASVSLSYTAPQEAMHVAFEATVTAGRIFYDESLACPRAWGLGLRDIEHPAVGEPFSIFVWFRDPIEGTRSLSTGHGGIIAIGVDLPTTERGGEVAPTDGSVTVSESEAGFASGWYNGPTTVPIADYALDPETTGEEFEIDTIAFRELPIDSPREAPENDCAAIPSPGACMARVDGRCFRTVEEACAFAGCPDSCIVQESLPAQIECF